MVKIKVRKHGMESFKRLLHGQKKLQKETLIKYYDLIRPTRCVIEESQRYLRLEHEDKESYVSYFTVNAIAYRLKDAKIVDLYDGEGDIAKKRLKAVGNADERFASASADMVDAIVATGASIVDMDFFEALGFKHYQADSQVNELRAQLHRGSSAQADPAMLGSPGTAGSMHAAAKPRVPA